MDAEVERHMDVFERPPELQVTHRSAFLPHIPNRSLFIYSSQIHYVEQTSEVLSS